MTREPLRRAVLGCALAIAAGVSLGDDVTTAPDARRGARTVSIDLPDDLGPALLSAPRTPATGVALLLHHADAGSLSPVIDRLAASTVLVPIDAARLDLSTTTPCAAIAERLAHASRRAQREAGLTSYLPPVVIGTGLAADLARRIVGAGDSAHFRAGVGTAPAAGRPGACADDMRGSPPGRWTTAPTGQLPDAAATALLQPLPRPSTGHEPLDRWLSHFELPLSAAWAPRPEAIVVMMSDARGLRPMDTALGEALVADNISVLSVDALRYFWQRRSPRDVAFELQRLVGALESLDVPVIAGGIEFGAESMAVAARLMDERSPDGLALVNPGPSAFFEVEPPLPALVPLIRRDWSTDAAVRALGLPTVCVSDAPDRTRVLCDSLAATAHVRSVHVPSGPSSDDPTRRAAVVVEEIRSLARRLARDLSPGTRAPAADDSREAAPAPGRTTR